MDDFKILKKNYGEEFAKFCRSNFPTQLETKGLLSQTIMSNFAPTKSLYEDIVSNLYKEQFVSYINSLTIEGDNNEIIETNETPEQIFDKIGYNLIKCETNKDVQSFKKYYAYDEELCTFDDPERIDTHIIFFAVRKDVEQIKRQNFTNPKREDEYGTSVMSIQFNKSDDNYLSIKNRYNHTVQNPDATYSNNLNNIYKGLTESFSKYYNLNITSKKLGFYMQDYVKASDGKFYKYHHIIDGVYYCTDNIIIDKSKNVIKLDKDKVELVDYFIIDKQAKEIKLYDKNLEDSFAESLGDIKKIESKILEKDKKILKIISKDGQQTELLLNKDNNIISYKNETIAEIKDSFLSYSKYIETFETQNAKFIGSNVLCNCAKLRNVYLPKVTEIGNDFCLFNNEIKEIDLPSVEKIGNCFLYRNDKLEKANILNVKHIGDSFCANNNCLKEVFFPKVKEIGDCFLDSNNTIKVLALPKDAIKYSKQSNYIKKTINKTYVKNLKQAIVKKIFPGLKSIYKNNEQENTSDFEM